MYGLHEVRVFYILENLNMGIYDKLEKWLYLEVKQVICYGIRRPATYKRLTVLLQEAHNVQNYSYCLAEFNFQ